MVGRSRPQSDTRQGGLLRGWQGIANARETESEAPDSGSCTTTMTELLAEFTDGLRALQSIYEVTVYGNGRGKI